MPHYEHERRNREARDRQHEEDWAQQVPWERGRWQEKQYNRQSRDTSGPYVGIGPKGYRRSDERIKEEVCERLTQHGQIDARRLEINVKNGEVTLTGTTPSRHVKRMVEDTIGNISGIRDIHNQLRIEQFSHQHSSNPNKIDEIGDTGVYPASGPLPNRNAEVQDMASWGHGEGDTGENK